MVIPIQPDSVENINRYKQFIKKLDEDISTKSNKMDSLHDNIREMNASRSKAIRIIKKIERMNPGTEKTIFRRSARPVRV